MRETLDVIYQSDDKYALITAISIISLLENNKEFTYVNIRILEYKITCQNKDKIKKIQKYYKNAKIDFISVEDSLIRKMAALKGVKPWNGHYFSWMKVFMFSLLDIDADIVIFIDSDTVVSGSLYDLMHQDMEDNVISMVLDLLTSRHKMKIGMDSADSYYNVGVMKIDLQKWKLHFQDFISYLEKENSNNIAEQDAINIFFKGKIKTLEPEWNYFSGYYAYGVDNILRATDLTDSNFYSKHLIMSKYYSPKIIHSTFGIAGKPWEINNKHPNFYQWDKYIKIGETYFEMMKFSKAKPTLTWCAYALLPRKLFMFLYKMKVEKKFG